MNGTVPLPVFSDHFDSLHSSTVSCPQTQGVLHVEHPKSIPGTNTCPPKTPKGSFCVSGCCLWPASPPHPWRCVGPALALLPHCAPFAPDVTSLHVIHFTCFSCAGSARCLSSVSPSLRSRTVSPYFRHYSLAPRKIQMNSPHSTASHSPTFLCAPNGISVTFSNGPRYRSRKVSIRLAWVLHKRCMACTT